MRCDINRPNVAFGIYTYNGEITNFDIQLSLSNVYPDYILPYYGQNKFGQVFSCSSYLPTYLVLI